MVPVQITENTTRVTGSQLCEVFVGVGGWYVCAPDSGRKGAGEDAEGAAQLPQYQR